MTGTRKFIDSSKTMSFACARLKLGKMDPFRKLNKKFTNHIGFRSQITSHPVPGCMENESKDLGVFEEVRYEITPTRFPYLALQ